MVLAMIKALSIALLLLGCTAEEHDNTSSVPSSNSSVLPSSSSITPSETYQTVVIGNQTWFARNLNYEPDTGNSACYDYLASNGNEPSAKLPYKHLLRSNTIEASWYLPRRLTYTEL